MTVTLPLRVYAWEDNILENVDILVPGGTSTVSATYTQVNLYDWNPGLPCILRPWWVFRDGAGPGLQNNLFPLDYPAGTPVADLQIPVAGYNEDTVTSTIEGLVGPIVGGLTNGAYSLTTHKFSIASTSSFDLPWTRLQINQRCGTTLGYDTSTDDSGAASYTADNATVCEDAQIVGWDCGDYTRAKPVKCVMIYMGPSVLGSTDTVTAYGSNKDHGADWMAWDGAAEYQGEEQLLHSNGINHMHLWFPEDDGIDYGLRYWMIAVKRRAAAGAATSTKIGVAGIWTEAWYEDDYNYSAPWVPEIVTGDVSSRAPGGGGLAVARNREHFRITLPFRQWPGATYRALAKLRWKRGLTPHLFVCNAKDVVTDNAIFGTIEGLKHKGYSNVEEDADFDMIIEQVPMEARGPIT